MLGKVVVSIICSLLWNSNVSASPNNPSGTHNPTHSHKQEGHQQNAATLLWSSAWYSPIDSKGGALEPQSLRQRIRSSIDGKKVRLQFSNKFGTSALKMTSVMIARSDGLGAIDLKSQRPVLFAGSNNVVIPPGQEIVSDSIDLPVKALEELAISFFLPEGTETATLHNTSMQNAQLYPLVDKTRSKTWGEAKQDDTRYFLKELEIQTSGKTGAIVAFGDSLTDGVGIENDRYHRWTDFLAERLQVSPKHRQYAVLNAGIAGNRLLRGASAPFIGNAGLLRFDEDVLQRAGVQFIIVSIGTNDISANHAFSDPSEQITYEDLVDGYQQLITRAHERSIKIIGTTIKPRGGAQGRLPHTPEAERLRIRINQWIRSASAFDGVIDFDLMLRDPAQVDRLNPIYDSGDHTHPNAAGYRVMANGIDLRLFQ
ncbi:SGNH/GDSL hydrolase family protein [Undibacterium cyanobacteriorum]|uniref:SGNH/GDSL hydrolase family protein n=1 Tax=Undibacterium cyanobacteriorum TaxID=3073561 RepID=A0ABY9REY7_9BURK|nr:SGNH/GDSL hydrolase family protein [Undibacterium sp. 20NA77.5]WMW79788.1 SGNH/GDSL hydrolase family protein [Undibacterium sp. 20NA77.5]